MVSCEGGANMWLNENEEAKTNLPLDLACCPSSPTPCAAWWPEWRSEQEATPVPQAPVRGPPPDLISHKLPSENILVVLVLTGMWRPWAPCGWANGPDTLLRCDRSCGQLMARQSKRQRGDYLKVNKYLLLQQLQCFLQKNKRAWNEVPW